MNRVGNIDRVIKIEEKIKKAIENGESKEYIQRLFWSLEKVEYKIDKLNDYSR